MHSYVYHTYADLNFCTCLLLRGNYRLHTSVVPQNVDKHLLYDAKFLQVSFLRSSCKSCSCASSVLNSRHMKAGLNTTCVGKMKHVILIGGLTADVDWLE